MPAARLFLHPGQDDTALLQLGEQRERFEPALLELGFLTHYATTNLENDFNSVTKQLFVPGPRFWRLAGQHPLIAAKARLTVGFYNKLDSAFCETYFRDP